MVDGPLKLNKKYLDNGIRILSEDQHDYQYNADKSNYDDRIYGIGIDYGLIQWASKKSNATELLNDEGSGKYTAEANLFKKIRSGQGTNFANGITYQTNQVSFTYRIYIMPSDKQGRMSTYLSGDVDPEGIGIGLYLFLTLLSVILGAILGIILIKKK